MHPLEAMEEPQNKSPKPAQARDIPQPCCTMRECPKENVAYEQGQMGDYRFAQ